MNAPFFFVCSFTFAATAFGQRLNTYIKVRAGDPVSNILPPPLWGKKVQDMVLCMGIERPRGGGGCNMNLVYLRNHTGRKKQALKHLNGKKNKKKKDLDGNGTIMAMYI